MNVLYPHFEKVRGGVEPWLMARWKARVEFLLSVIGLLFLSLAVEALQGKKVSRLAAIRGVGQFEPRFQGKGSSLGSIFSLYKTRHILLSDGANCTVLRAVVLTQYRTDGRTDRQTDGIAVSSTALAMRVLRRAVKIKHCQPMRADVNLELF